MNGRRKISDQLSAYLDGELSDAESDRVEQAVAQDKQMAEELSQLRAVRGMVRNLPRRQAPDDFVSNVLAMVERKHLVTSHVAERGEFSWGRYVATAAVVLLAVGIGGVIGVTLWKTPQITPHSDSKLAAVTVKDAWIDNLNYDDRSGSLTLSDVKGDAVAVSNVEIYTDNIAETRKAIEKSLFSQNLKLLTPEKARKEAVVIDGSLNNSAFGNYYNSLRVNDEQVQILAYVNEKQMPVIEDTLNTIRSRQRVSQSPEDGGVGLLAEHKTDDGLSNKDLSGGGSMGKTSGKAYSGKDANWRGEGNSKVSGKTLNKPGADQKTADNGDTAEGTILAKSDKTAQDLERAKRELEDAKLHATAGAAAPATPPVPPLSPVAASQPALVKTSEPAANGPVVAGVTAQESLPATAPASIAQINAARPASTQAGGDFADRSINVSQQADIGRQAMARQSQSQFVNNTTQANSQNRMQSQLANGRRLDLTNNANGLNLSANNRAVLITINLRQTGAANNMLDVQKAANLAESSPSTQPAAAPATQMRQFQQVQQVK